MTYRVSRRLFLSGLGSFLAAPHVSAGAPQVSIWPQARPDGFRRQVLGGPERVLAKAGLTGAAAFAVADARTGALLEAHDGGRKLPPASVTKTVTALYALQFLGPSHRFTTQVLGTGTLRNGVLSGDLYLAGGGDPTLDTNHLAALAKALRDSGVREVAGGFFVYDGALPFVRTIDSDQPDHLGYSPAVSGIALNFNRVHFEWKRASGRYSVRMDARTRKYRPEVATATMRIANRDVPTYTYRADKGIDSWTVARPALGNGGARWLPVRDPAAYAGDVFRTMARAHGLVLRKAKTRRSLPGGAQVLARHSSAPLNVILRDMLKFSNNLTAEMVGLSATAARGGVPSSLRASARMMSDWARSSLDMGQCALVDHSGLGEASRMTPTDLVKALVKVRERGILRPILKPVTLRDSGGRPVKNHPIKVDAKTGTLNYVSGLGGYMTAADGTELAFAIFTADTQARSRIKRADRERPKGAKGWNRRSKKLQQALIERWGALYGSS